MGLSYNYNRLESDLRYRSHEKIEDIVRSNALNFQLIDVANGSIQAAIGELNIGKKYWKYCIILALLFLAVEIALIKLLR
jgi:hypothetical protein